MQDNFGEEKLSILKVLAVESYRENRIDHYLSSFNIECGVPAISTAHIAHRTNLAVVVADFAPLPKTMYFFERSERATHLLRGVLVSQNNENQKNMK